MKKSADLMYITGIAAMVLMFFLLSTVYKEKEIVKVDRSVIHTVTAHQPEELTSVFIHITNSAARTNEFLVLIAFSAYFILKARRLLEPFILTICLFGIRYGNSFLKEIYERERPSLHRLVDIGGYSFPSGHAMISIGFFGLVLYFLLQLLKKTWLRRLAAVLGSIYIFLVGYSRIYLGVHYPSDVLAGFLAGGSYLLICILLYRFMMARVRNERSS